MAHTWTNEAEQTALRFIASAYEALAAQTKIGLQQADDYSHRVADLIITYGAYKGHSVREQWLELCEARRVCNANYANLK